MQVPEEAAFRMWLHAKDVPVAVAERGDVEGGPTRVPRISGILRAVVDEAKPDLTVADHLLQNPFLAVGGEQELALRVGRDERDARAFLQGPGERARTAVLHAKEARSALVMARVVRREGRLPLVPHHAPPGREESRLDEDPGARSYAQNRPGPPPQTRHGGPIT